MQTIIEVLGWATLLALGVGIIVWVTNAVCLVKRLNELKKLEIQATKDKVINDWIRSSDTNMRLFKSEIISSERNKETIGLIEEVIEGCKTSKDGHYIKHVK